VPLAHLEWDDGAFSLTPLQVADELRRGEPGILIPAISTGLMFSPQCIEPGEEVVIAERLKAVLRAA
jgi:hypothetical protein